MFDCAEFTIVGRVGQVKKFDKIVRVTIAANASYKKKGEWVKRIAWNEVAIFDANTRKHVQQNVRKGDYVRATGTIASRSYEKDGETQYTTDLTVASFSRLPRKAEKEE